MVLGMGADVNAKNGGGNSALIGASTNGHTEIVARLLEEGANVNMNDNYGYTALMWASNMGHTRIVEMLLERPGIDANAKMELGWTALMMANQNEHTEIIELLRKHIVAQTIPRHLERQQKRLQVGRVMDKKRMPGDLTHKIITEHFGGKRRTRKSHYKKTRKRRR